MRNLIVGLTIAGALVAAGSSPAFAQSAPQGSYQQSCNNARVSGDQLQAQCRNSQGYVVRSSIDLNSCRNGDIGNVDGNLRCLAMNQNGQDGQSQADPNTMRVRLDGRDVDLQPGQHTIRVSGRDAYGRPVDQTWQFTTNPPVVSNFIDSLQPADNTLVPNSMVVSGRTNPNAHLVVQLSPSGDQRSTLNGFIGQTLGVGPRPDAVRVETNADGNGRFSVQIDIDAGRGQQLNLIVDSTEPRTQSTAHMSRTLVIR